METPMIARLIRVCDNPMIQMHCESELAEVHGTIAQREAIIASMVGWLEKNQPDVFSRGLWDALNPVIEPEMGPISRAEMDRRFVVACEQVDPFNRNR